MRVPRIKESAGGYYHVLSRVVDRRMALNDSEKERFRKLMRRTETFSGVRILTHSVLDNHFHILIHVPACRAVSDSEFCERITALYDKSEVKNIMQQLAELREDGRDEAAELVKAPYVARMYELSEFCKTLKQRFTQSFNKRRGRKGTLWEERFKSILLQGSEGALSTVAAYIDLNAVRAGIVADPRDYRFSGYGEAVGGSRSARRGLAAVMQGCGLQAGWKAVHAAYRKLLYSAGTEAGLTKSGAPKNPGFSREDLQKVLDQGGRLTLQQALHCRVRYFTDGLVLGSREYVDDAFYRYRDRFGHKRKSGARKCANVDLGDLFTARRLQLAVITVPDG